jgi:hypothetical protein
MKKSITDYPDEKLPRKQVMLDYNVSASQLAYSQVTGYLKKVRAPRMIQTGNRKAVARSEMEAWKARYESFQSTFLGLKQLSQRMSIKPRAPFKQNHKIRRVRQMGVYWNIEFPPVYKFTHTGSLAFWHVDDVELFNRFQVKRNRDELSLPSDRHVSSFEIIWKPAYTMPIVPEFADHYTEKTMQRALYYQSLHESTPAQPTSNVCLSRLDQLAARLH